MVLNEEKNYNILIVDDISMNIKVLGNILRHESYALSFATNGKQAVEMATSDSFSQRLS